MRNLYSYDISAFEEQISRVPINEITREYVNIGALKLLCIYDACGDKKVLSIVEKLLDELSAIDDPYNNVAINKLQVKKRMGIIGNEDLGILKKFTKCGKAPLEFAANVLLDDKESASQKYCELRDDEIKELEETPIMTLYQEMTSMEY